jgi:hypothetical protein
MIAFLRVRALRKIGIPASLVPDERFQNAGVIQARVRGGLNTPARWPQTGASGSGGVAVAMAGAGFAGVVPGSSPITSPGQQLQSGQPSGHCSSPAGRSGVVQQSSGGGASQGQVATQ